MDNSDCDENLHPNVSKQGKIKKKEIAVFKNAFSPDELKLSANKRYETHFNNEEYFENDILYDICQNEDRPSKNATSNNTALTTMRDESKVFSHQVSSNITARSLHPQRDAKMPAIHLKRALQPSKSPEKQPSSPGSSRIENLASMVLIDISEKNTEKHINQKREEEKYEQDIRALKKKLDFLNNSNCRLIESSLKKQSSKTIQHSQERDRRDSEYIYTERRSNCVSQRSDNGPDIMKYVSYNNIEKGKQDRSTLGLEPGHSRNFDRSNLPANAMYEI